MVNSGRRQCSAPEASLERNSRCRMSSPDRSRKTDAGCRIGGSQRGYPAAAKCASSVSASAPLYQAWPDDALAFGNEGEPFARTPGLTALHIDLDVDIAARRMRVRAD